MYVSFLVQHTIVGHFCHVNAHNNCVPSKERISKYNDNTKLLYLGKAYCYINNRTDPCFYVSIPLFLHFLILE